MLGNICQYLLRLDMYRLILYVVLSSAPACFFSLEECLSALSALFLPLCCPNRSLNRSRHCRNSQYAYTVQCCSVIAELHFSNYCLSWNRSVWIYQYLRWISLLLLHTEWIAQLTSWWAPSSSCSRWHFWSGYSPYIRAPWYEFSFLAFVF